MNRTTRLIAAALVAAAAPAIAAQAADANAPRMADVMSATELKETGVASLTPSQRAALDSWLARYTGIVEHAASRGAAAAGATAGGGDNNTNEAYSGPVAVPYGSRVRLVREGGTSIVLADGTVWEVYLPNRPSTRNWAPGDFVIVTGRAVEQNGEFYFTLTNGRDGSSAAVNWKGKE
jgi:hypothetical protein